MPRGRGTDFRNGRGTPIARISSVCHGAIRTKRKVNGINVKRRREFRDRHGGVCIRGSDCSMGKSGTMIDSVDRNVFRGLGCFNREC